MTLLSRFSTVAPFHGPIGRKGRVWGVIMTAFAAFGGMPFGYDTGAISGIIQMDDWVKTFGEPDHSAPTGFSVSISQGSLVVHILSAGTFLGAYTRPQLRIRPPLITDASPGALVGAPAADTLGQRTGIMLTCLVFSLGVALQTAAPNVATFVAGRFFAGLGVGLVSTLVPMYQSECAPRQVRGALVACYQWAISIGILLAVVVNNAAKDRAGHSSWQVATGVQFVCEAVLCVGMVWLPEVRGRIEREYGFVY